MKKTDTNIGRVEDRFVDVLKLVITGIVMYFIISVSLESGVYTGSFWDITGYIIGGMMIFFFGLNGGKSFR